MATKNIGVNFYRSLHRALTGLARDHNSSAHITEAKFYSEPQPTSIPTPARHLISDNATSLGAVLIAQTGQSFTTIAGATWKKSSKGIIRGPDIPLTSINPGTISWVRLEGFSGADYCLDLTVTEPGGGGDVIVDTVMVTAAQNFIVYSIGVNLDEEFEDIKLTENLRNQLLDSLFGDDLTPQPNTAGEAILGGNCDLHIYSGSPPSSVNDPATGTLLATKTIGDYPDSMTNWDSNNTLVPGDGAGSLSSIAMLPMIAVGTGSVGYFRWVKGLNIVQGTCGLSNVNLAVDKATVSTGESISMIEMAILPNI